MPKTIDATQTDAIPVSTPATTNNGHHAPAPAETPETPPILDANNSVLLHDGTRRLLLRGERPPKPITGNPIPNHPLMAAAGSLKDAPLWEEWQEAIREVRRQMEQEEREREEREQQATGVF